MENDLSKGFSNDKEVHLFPLGFMLPVLPVFENILFPHAILELSITTPIARAAVEHHLNSDTPILVLPQQKNIHFPAMEDIFSLGCQARVLRCLTIDESSCTILIEGLERVQIQNMTLDDDIGYLAEPVDLPQEDISEEEALFWMERLRNAFGSLIKNNEEIHPELQPLFELELDDERFIYMCSNNLMLSREQKIIILASTNLREQAQILLAHIEQEQDFLQVNNNALEKVQSKIEQQNRAYFVKQQIRSLQEELEEVDQDLSLETNRDLNKLKVLFEENPPPKDVWEEIQAEFERLSKMPVDASEYNVGKNWLSALAKLPWNSPPAPEVDIEKAQQILDEEHYGLEKIKERIIEQLAVQKLKGESLGTVLCFVGPPGVGKTSLTKSIAKALGRPFERISLAGIKDEAEIRGHRRTYIGSMAGRFIRAIQKAQSRSALLLLDEIDKIGRDVRGDPSSALLEILDPEQNTGFVDHYIDVPFDFSQVFFVCTANTLDSIDPALRDRLEILELHSYTLEEKQEIVHKHLIPKVAAEHAITKLDIHTDLIPFIINGYTREAGLRKLSQKLASLARKTALAQLKGEDLFIESQAQVRSFLGPELPPPTSVTQLPIGQSLGLAWTPVGGEILRIQAMIQPHTKDTIHQTGNLGSVMKESIEVAYTYIRTHHHKEATTAALHLHVPQGAVSKDGPSAGMAIAMAIYGAIHQRKIANGIAMTGELDLGGNIGAIGGLKEKILAAYRLDVRTIIIPKENEHELMDIPQHIQSALQIHLVSHIDETLALCFPKS